MPTLTYTALTEFDRGNASHAQAMLENLTASARWQIAGHWPEIRRHCLRRVAPQIERRSVNGLSVEASGASLDRCTLQSPDGRGLRWLLSGGDVRAYGACCLERCPLATSEV